MMSGGGENGKEWINLSRGGGVASGHVFVIFEIMLQVKMDFDLNWVWGENSVWILRRIFLGGTR